MRVLLSLGLAAATLAAAPAALAADVRAVTTTDAFVVSSSTAPMVIAATTTMPTIFQMRDGRFYEPRSGLTALTRQQVLIDLGFSSSAPAEVTAASTSSTSLESSTSSLKLLTAASSSTWNGDFPLHRAIIRAWELLNQATTSSNVTLAAAKHRRTKPLSLVIALWDRQTDAITFINKPPKTRGPGVDVSSYAGPNQVVVAVAYPLMQPATKNTPLRKGKKKSIKKNSPANVTMEIYTPYSDALRTPEMAAWGRQTLERMVSAAYQSLRRQRTGSWAFPERLAADVIDPDLVKSLMVIEHADRQTLTKDPRRSLDQFFIAIGANQEHAYQYAQSSAGALGLAQFMPKTYAELVRVHPSEGLIPDFHQAMAQPQNAIQAQVLYLDQVLAEMPPAIKDAYLNDAVHGREYLVAAYNAGGARVRRAVMTWGGDWATSTLAQVDAKSLQRQRSKLQKTIKALTKQVKWTKDKTRQRQLQADKQAAQRQLAALNRQRNKKAKGTLKRETVEYLLKYRAAYQSLRANQPTIKA